MVRKSKEKEKTGDGSGSAEGSVPPFLRKCYEMVDDEETDSIISWSESNDSFVIRDVTQFSVLMLPKNFKHSNFSSFMRQLNIYGFRKIDPDHYVFANEGFIRGQKHLLKNIFRRKYPQGTDQSKTLQQKDNQRDDPDEPSEDIESGLWREVENLKIDKISLKQELVKLRQHQEISENNLLLLRDRLHGMEKDQQQMLSFLVMAMQNPGFLVQLVQSKEHSWRFAEAGNMLEEVDDGRPMAADGAIVRYQPLMDEAPEPVFTPHSGSEIQPEIDSFVNSDGVIVRYQPVDEAPDPVFTPNFVSEKQPEFDSYPDGVGDSFMNSDGAIVRYRSPMDAAPKPILTQSSGSGKQPEFDSYPDGMKDFFVNSDLVKMLMDDKLSPRENHAPFILPDADVDDNAWEKLLLTSYLLENTEGAKEERKEPEDSRMEVESTAAELDESKNFDSLIEQMNKSVHGSNMENSRNLEFIGEHLGLMASEPNKKQETQLGK
ncbi:putative transcription factor HSF-type-DNA-binding family [Rosa chinensis]|uniref:Putative transcription factor HSF-type-DNA-binding family n=1 Tax=Rosa chinensis TaxID=74649 RepID=A0A2P6R3N3_ROSCH|nr:heat stress transcription factor A-1 [Rosa chinensis]PRQ41036.1 putative transcription factor HSF-type-DNA-binding family [Rosa chinensis]